MSTKVKGNNKGFSLVELIVVMAIMAILAVTLAPRLSQYVEKSRKASDQEVVNTIFTAAKLANVQFPNEFEDVSAPVSDVITWSIGTEATDADTPATTNLYSISFNTGTDWSISQDYLTAQDNDFLNEMASTLSNFKLKSKDVSDTTTITVGRTADGLISVTLDYSGGDTFSEDAGDYKVSE